MSGELRNGKEEYAELGGEYSKARALGITVRAAAFALRETGNHNQVWGRAWLYKVTYRVGQK